MSENTIEFIKVIIILFSLGFWLVNVSGNLAQNTTPNSKVSNTATVYNPQTYYQTIILR